MRKYILFILLFFSPLLCLGQQKEIAVFSDSDFSGEIWIKELRHDRQRIVVKVNYKEQDEIIHRFFIVDPNTLQKQEIKSFAGFDKQLNPELPKQTELRLKSFLETDFKPHKGILGGTVKYRIVSRVYSPDKSKIAFMIKGEDGHTVFNPSLLIFDVKKNAITKIDSTPHDTCKDIVWISDNEIVYAKESSVYISYIPRSK